MIQNLINNHSQLFEQDQQGFNLVPFINTADKLLPNNQSYLQLKGEILDAFPLEGPQLHDFTRVHLLSYWEGDYTFGSKMLLTLWWGGLSHQFQAPKFYTESNFSHFVQIGEPAADSIIDLYKYFENIKEGFDGVGYRYFTKFMQFLTKVRGIDTPQCVIADQWSMKAVIAYLIQSKDFNRLNQIFTPLTYDQENNRIKNPDFRSIRRSKSIAYLMFLEIFKEILEQAKQIAGNLNLDLYDVEEKLFGWGHDIDNQRNPRNYYHQIIIDFLNNN
jgi:hypothetical protein